jgi:hypothetical protein
MDDEQSVLHKVIKQAIFDGFGPGSISAVACQDALVCVSLNGKKMKIDVIAGENNGYYANVELHSELEIETAAHQFFIDNEDMEPEDSDYLLYKNGALVISVDENGQHQYQFISNFQTSDVSLGLLED